MCCNYSGMFSYFRAKPQRPGLPPARPQKAPPKPRRSLPPRAIPGPLTPRARQKPAWHKATVPGPEMVALHLGEDQVTQPGGSWAFPPPLLHLQPLDNHRRHRPRTVPLCSGLTSTARALWRLWLASRETRAVPISWRAGCRTGTDTTAGALPSHQVADALAPFVFWSVSADLINTWYQTSVGFSELKLWKMYLCLKSICFVLFLTVQQQGLVSLEAKMMDQDTKLLCSRDLRGWERPPQLPWSVRSVWKHTQACFWVPFLHTSQYRCTHDSQFGQIMS